MIKKSFVLAHLDDDPLELKRIQRALTKNKNDSAFAAHSFTRSQEFLTFINETPVLDFCILDIQLSEDEKTDGISLIQSIKKLHPQCAVIMSSFHDHIQSVLHALNLQADDFISKSFASDNLPERLLQVQRYLHIKNGYSEKENKLSESNYSLSKCAGKTLKTIESRIKLILQSSAKSILVEGETGTGKEVIADLFESHIAPHNPFIRLNCGSISPNLLESELFGHKKGAFTGALQDSIGFIEAAHNGCLFLDEVSSLSLQAQAALLRVIENQEIIRLGETQPRKINVRFICASNIPLNTLVSKNQFRQDLWQRLNEIHIYLPPLYQRKEEISDLLDYFCSKFKERKYVLDPLAKKILCSFEWREGNVRELRNTLRAMTEFSENGVLSVSAIPQSLLIKMQENLVQEASLKTDIKNTGTEIRIELPSGTSDKIHTYSELCNELFKQLIRHKMQKTEKLNLSLLAKELDISRTTLQSKIRDLNL